MSTVKPLSKQAQKIENIRRAAAIAAEGQRRLVSATHEELVQQASAAQVVTQRPVEAAIADPETLAMAHRYLYYVENTNVISDHQYDVLERQARAVAPAESKIHGVGSSLASEYTAAQVACAMRLIES